MRSLTIANFCTNKINIGLNILSLHPSILVSSRPFKSAPIVETYPFVACIISFFSWLSVNLLL